MYLYKDIYIYHMCTNDIYIYIYTHHDIPFGTIKRWVENATRFVYPLVVKNPRGDVLACHLRQIDVSSRKNKGPKIA